MTGGGAGTQIQLVAPPSKVVGSSKSFPTDPSAFSTTVWPLLTTYCSRCHQASAAVPQQPYFASSDLATAYAAAQTKIDLDDPSQSRFVLRLRNEFHNCWAGSGGTVDCSADADTMQAAITTFANGIQPVAIDPALVISKALAMYDGTPASGGSRIDTNAIAIYEFKTGTGSTAYDTSGVSPAADLTLSTTATGGFSWVGGYGVQFAGGKAQALTSASKKFTDLINATGEYSIEAWAAPANVAQTKARIVSYSGGTTTRNFELGQTMYDYDFFNHTTASDANGAPALSTPAAAQVLQASLQHVVVTYDPVNGRRIYVNGAFTGTADASGAPLANWDNTFALVLGNEVSGTNAWLGTLKFVAIHNRALTLPQIQQNFAAGVGERYFLLFDVASITGISQSYIMFEVSEYDSYAYLFKNPKFISLDPNAKPGNLVLKGMRLGINGVVATVGQAYSTLDEVVTDAMYTSIAGESLSNVGMIIGLQKGPASDDFFLTFDQLGSQTHVYTEPAAPTPAPPADMPLTSTAGNKTFDAINTSMAKVTGVSVNNANVLSTYATVKQALTTIPDFTSFGDSQATAITTLATAYCTELVKDSTLSTNFFGTTNFDLSTTGSRAPILNAIVNKVNGLNLSSQPALATEAAELDLLIGNTASGRVPGLCQSAPCTGARTTTVVIAACTAALSSGTATIQ